MTDLGRTLNVDDGANAAEMRAAYLLGRNVHLLEGWLNAVDAIARCEGRPWTWEYPYTLFGNSFTTWPSELYCEVDEAVRTLVLGRVVDAAALVEFRHSLELVARDCATAAEFAKFNQRDEIGELAWPLRSTMMSAPVPKQSVTSSLTVGSSSVARQLARRRMP